MTAEELRRKFNDEFAFGDWPDHYEVDADTYANVCQYIFDAYGEDASDGIIQVLGNIKRLTISVGVNNGILFKNVELILKPAGETPNQVMFNHQEIMALYKLLANTYVSYEEPGAIEVVRKIQKFSGV